MTTGHDGGSAGDGGPARHIPVLVRPVIEFLAPKPDGVYVDGTFGAGGYSRAILAIDGTRVIGIDRDQSAVAGSFSLVDAAGGRLSVVEGRFSELDAIAASTGCAKVDGVVLDLGVSSMQLDTPERGFSFRFDGPLDMRMGSEELSAADVVAVATEAELARIVFLLGEERHSRAVARAIVAARREAPVVSTRGLADIVARVVRSRPGDIHPATRTFQALRLFVNDELGELSRGLLAAERILAPGGRLVVVSFHSLEDRMVKSFLVSRGLAGGGSRHLPEIVRAPSTFTILTKKPIIADDAELGENPRSRSAKLRAAERNAAPARGGEVPDEPVLPSLADMARRR